MKKLPLYLTVGVLVAAGLSLILYKVLVLGFPLQPHKERSIWTVQARFTVDGHTRPVKAILQVLSSTPGFTVLDENFVSRGFGLTIVEEEGTREAQWAIRRAAGRQTFYYQAVVTTELSGAVEAPCTDRSSQRAPRRAVCHGGGGSRRSGACAIGRRTDVHG